MTTHCEVCLHPARESIEDMLAGAYPLDDVRAEYDDPPSRYWLGRHRHQHLSEELFELWKQSKADAWRVRPTATPEQLELLHRQDERLRQKIAELSQSLDRKLSGHPGDSTP